MTRLQYFESGNVLQGVKLGVISPEMLQKYDGYRTYLDFLNKGIKKSEAILLTADQQNVDRSTIARYIYWFERDDNVRNAAHAETIGNPTLAQQ